MPGEFVLFLIFALAYTAAWWLVMRGTLPVVHEHVGEEEAESTPRRDRPSAGPSRMRATTATEARATRAAEEVPRKSIPLPPPKPATLKTAPGTIPAAWSLPSTVAETPSAASEALQAAQQSSAISSAAREDSASVQPTAAATKLAMLEPPVLADVSAPAASRERAPVDPDNARRAAIAPALIADAVVATATHTPDLPTTTLEHAPRTPIETQPPNLHVRELACASTTPNDPMTTPDDAMNSNPLDFPNWMEETMNSRAKPESTPESSPRATSTASEAPTSAKNAAETGPTAQTASSAAPIASTTEAPTTGATVPSTTRSTTPSGTAGESLRGLSRIEKERMHIMSQLDAWARAWAEVEKRNGQCVDDLARQVESLAQEHAQCDGRRREMEQRTQEQSARGEAELKNLRGKLVEFEPFVQQAKELGARCTDLDRELVTARSALDQQKRECGALDERWKNAASEMDKLKDHLARSQEATKEATARDLDWQRRYHEDTGKLMQQLTTKSQESERWIGENQKQKSEIDRQTCDLRAKDEIVQTMSLRCSDLDQRHTTQVGALQERDARIVELARQLADMQKELEVHKAAEEEQASMLQAAQGVLSELQPKLSQLEKRLSKH